MHSRVTAPRPYPTDTPLLRCDACRRTVAYSDTDMLAYSRAGRWPKCCGEVMALAVEADIPGRTPHWTER